MAWDLSVEVDIGFFPYQPRDDRCTWARSRQLQVRSAGEEIKKGNEPRRIGTHTGANSGLTMRQQLQAVRYYKRKAAAIASRPVKPASRTAFKKEKPKEGTEEFVQKKQERFKSKQPLAALSMYGEDGTRIPSTMLVDGYNIVGAWPRLKKYFMAGDLDTARERLMSDLGEYLHFKGIRIIVVWDARGGFSTSTSEDVLQYGVEVVYEAVDTADTYIEAKARELLDSTKGLSTVLVATDDRETRHLVYGHGAYTCGSKMLIQDINKAKREGREQLRDPRTIGKVSGSRLGDMVKGESREVLLQVLEESRDKKLQKQLARAKRDERVGNGLQSLAGIKVSNKPNVTSSRKVEADGVFSGKSDRLFHHK
eukprot:CAMPEP_0114322462 /NCGR_PEP_ID=MMETSP0059-20121206/27239_1 /TAXON_ID=36894 /ORGANISM="Pyramimonas parkeae, Strain CCMP726" /LENGTH=366 /DNA_ID=CAMNT_0001450441 /DNA_START=244 /DNA_END=1344 /DNA_ORIENTATION=-